MKKPRLDLLDHGVKLLEAMALKGGDRLKRRFDSGDKGALLSAVFDCANAGIPLHKWAAAAFQDAYVDVKVNLRHASWDDVFGLPHPKKHQKLPALRAKRQSFGSFGTKLQSCACKNLGLITFQKWLVTTQSA